MTETNALPVFRADIQVVLDVSAADYDEAVERLADIAAEIETRLRRSTFQRLPGKPRVEYAIALEPSVR